MMYGTYPTAQESQVARLVGAFTEACLKAGFRFITRNGGQQDGKSLWPGAKHNWLPIDNLVIASVAQTLPRICPGTPIGSRLRTYVTLGRTRPVDVGQEFLDCPGRRFEMYSVFLDEADVIVFVGGSHGVLRFALMCHVLQHSFVAVTAYGGASKEEVGDSFYSHVHERGHYQNLRRSDILMLGDQHIHGADLLGIVQWNLQSRALFALRETLAGRMEVRDLLALGIAAGERLATFLGRVMAILCVVTLVFLLFREYVIPLVRSIAWLVAVWKGHASK